MSDGLRSRRSGLAGVRDLATAARASLAHLVGLGRETDWTLIREAMHASGSLFPGNVLRFELVRQDLTSLAVNGQPVPVSEFAALASGFIAFRETEAGQFYIVGSLPALESEVSALLTALRINRVVRVTAIAGRLLGESPRLIGVSFEATGDGVAIATSLDRALQAIHSPQLHIVTAPGVGLVMDATRVLPPQFIALFRQGTVQQLLDTLVLHLPRPDEHRIRPHAHVPASVGLGIGQTIYIQLPSFSGSPHMTVNISLALGLKEVQPVEDVLRVGRFTIASQTSSCLDSQPHLVHVSAQAFGDGFSLGNTLLSVIHLIELEASSRDHNSRD